MNKLALIKNPDLFQGEKFLKSNKNYFEGWYFKNTNRNNSISFIPGISIDKNERKSFIQIITNSSSYFVNYDINLFKFSYVPFSIQIENNIFSKDGIYIDINDETQNLKVSGALEYSDSKNINTNFFNPNIMGPFSYIPFMECNHAILSMKNCINGMIKINENKINFNNDIGYIEKDWGISFPKSYIWCQGNNFKKSNSSFMISIADIPFKFLSFRGVICSFIKENTEYKFTTYNNTKIVKYLIEKQGFDIVLQKGKYRISIKSEYLNGNKLIAPVKGNMNKDIIESITAKINVVLQKEDKILFNDTSSNCGLEIVE